MKECKVSYCDKNVFSLGLCRSHYRNQKLYGDPTAARQIQHHNLSLKERFFKYVSKGSDCWEWLGSKDNNGYGKIRVDGKPELASRTSWRIHYGDIPKGLCVCHHCDNPSCVNPEHLFVGTQKDNVIDMKNKGRERKVGKSGENHNLAKVTEEIVKKIRLEGNTSKEYCDSVGLSKSAVHSILTRKTWAHVQD